METFIGLIVPFFGTATGAAMVLMLRDKISDLTNRAMLGFASGVMVAAAFWSLLQPAFEQAGEGFANAWPVLAGFIAGMCFLLLLDTNPHLQSAKIEKTNSCQLFCCNNNEVRQQMFSKIHKYCFLSLSLHLVHTVCTDSLCAVVILCKNNK